MHTLRQMPPVVLWYLLVVVKELHGVQGAMPLHVQALSMSMSTLRLLHSMLWTPTALRMRQSVMVLDKGAAALQTGTWGHHPPHHSRPCWRCLPHQRPRATGGGGMRGCSWRAAVVWHGAPKVTMPAQVGHAPCR